MFLLACMTTGAATATSEVLPAAHLPSFKDEADWKAYRASIESEIERARTLFATAARDAQPGERVTVRCGGLSTTFIAGNPIPLLGSGHCEVETKAGTRSVEISATMWGAGPWRNLILGPGEFAQRFPQQYVQAAGVETGQLFKRSGDYFLFLRRGKLFSFLATDDELRMVSSANVTGPAKGKHDDWYEEMLVDGRTIVVLGFDLDRASTRIELFDLDLHGQISHRDGYSRAVDVGSFHMSGNYASRLEGHTLVFYSPVAMDFIEERTSRLPPLRRWSGTEFEDLEPLAAGDIYRSRIAETDAIQSLHLMTRCQLDVTPMRCQTNGVLAPHNSWAYPALDAVYVWANAQGESPEDYALLRLPFDGSAPSSLRVQGSPQARDAVMMKDGYLNALVDADAETLRMWRSQSKRGGSAFLRVPITSFGDEKAESRPEQYRALQERESYARRFVGDWLLYNNSDPDRTIAMRIDIPRAPVSLPLADVGLFEEMGQDAITFGYLPHDTQIGVVALGDEAHVLAQLRSPQAGTPDSRTIGGAYHPLGAGRGFFAQPLAEITEPTASLQFYGFDQGRLSHVGELLSSPKREDGCEVSCDPFDWFGDSRAIFIGDRIYAFIGYELVEARLEQGRIRETRRIDFTPRVPKFLPPPCYQGEIYRGQTGPGTPVVIENAFTGFRREIRADAQGEFEFTGLQPGSYTVTIGSEIQSVEAVELKFHDCKPEAEK
jgi:hypothetical protein